MQITIHITFLLPKQRNYFIRCVGCGDSAVNAHNAAMLSSDRGIKNNAVTFAVLKDFVVVSRRLYQDSDKQQTRAIYRCGNVTATIWRTQ